MRALDRRRFLVGSLAASATALVPRGAIAQAKTPYGPLEGRTADANGIILPEGFTSRIVAKTGDILGASNQPWHTFPDGGATFSTPGGGWIYVSNSEDITPGAGGASAVTFAADGTIVDNYRILDDTLRNCAGGATPWGTWLSCEEYEFELGEPLPEGVDTRAGRVWECDPTGEDQARPLPALGLFQHEAVAVDPTREQLYLTEDQPDGLLYRFTPDAYPELAGGLLEAAVVADDGSVTWLAVPDATAAEANCRAQIPEATPFAGGEGVWIENDIVFFTTKFDGRVHALDLGTASLSVLYDGPSWGDDPPLRGLDNLTGDGAGDLFVAEDLRATDPISLVVVTEDGTVSPFLEVTGQDSELVGPSFNPAGDRLYFSSQSAISLAEGITYEVTGPFRHAGSGSAPSVPTTGTTTTTAPAAPTTTALEAVGDSSDDGGDGLLIGGAVALAAAAAAGTWAVRSRRSTDQDDDPADSAS